LGSRNIYYNTKQGEAVLEYLSAHKGNYITAAQIVEHFQSGGNMASRTTIYRQLSRLVQEGKVQKYAFEGISGACYQYVNQSRNKHCSYHLKCEGCGEITDLKCNEVDLVSQHIYETHDFRVNDQKTVFYGKCKTCIQE
jgi:Fur family ferric uptake transcriptional regulator